MRPLRFLLAASLLVACASPTEGTGETGQAIGERWYSNVEVGTYDTYNASVTVTNTLQGQRLAYSGPMVFFAGSVSRDGGGIKVEDDNGEGTLTATQGGANLVVSHDGPGFLGDFAGLTFVRRPANALKNVYPQRNGGALEIESSTDDRLTLRITTAGGRTYRTTATRPGWPFKSASSYDLEGELDGCTVTVERSAGKFAFAFLGGLNESCPLGADWISR